MLRPGDHEGLTGVVTELRSRVSLVARLQLVVIIISSSSTAHSGLRGG